MVFRTHLGLNKVPLLWGVYFVNGVVTGCNGVTVGILQKFRPGLCADFGKYFVCFRVRREQVGDGRLIDGSWQS